jgi:AcrR family transcriptional regulator
MRQNKLDRRSLRTRQLLMEALIGLMRDKRYDAITVQEITDRANVGRSTFYAHFTDKDDLLVDGVRRMLDSLEDPAHGAAVPRWELFPTLALLHHLRAQADMYQVMARGRGLTLFQAALAEELTTVLAERLAARVAPGHTPAVAPPMLAAMITSMLVTAIRIWLEDGAKTPPESIERIFRTVAHPVIRAGLRPSTSGSLSGP